MNIGFYGHSNIAYTGAGSYLNIVADEFDAKIINTGVKQGSEERILFELKKTRNIDFAIIAHSYPSCVFLPSCDRDVSVARLKDERIDNLSQQDSFAKAFGTTENFAETMLTYLTHFHDPDLSVNRFLGAAAQIVQYLDAKCIPAIHITSATRFPSWFSYGNGIVNVDDIVKDYTTYEQKRPFFHNCLSPEGNVVVANKLIELMRPVVR